MAISGRSLRTVARIAAGLAGLTGAHGVLALLGAFGPAACINESASGEGVDSEGTTDGAAGGADASTSGEVADGCVSGIDYVLGGAGGNAPEVFAWPLVLLGLVTVGGVAAWTGRRRATWAAAVAGAVVSIAGFLSIGWYFALPSLFLLVAAAALTVAASWGLDGSHRPGA